MPLTESDPLDRALCSCSEYLDSMLAAATPEEVRADLATLAECAAIGRWLGGESHYERQAANESERRALLRFAGLAESELRRRGREAPLEWAAGGGTWTPRAPLDAFGGASPASSDSRHHDGERPQAVDVSRPARSPAPESDAEGEDKENIAPDCELVDGPRNAEDEDGAGHLQHADDERVAAPSRGVKRKREECTVCERETPERRSPPRLRRDASMLLTGAALAYAALLYL
ncbi:hypothetical protein AURDEDRAFT_112353 [Auricularia subglabra TFB-10046 SS5]|nr:hypothetical protein AURDEDRAFT_112353 [Auricularia subglabra TFB-10046 SS5]